MKRFAVLNRNAIKMIAALAMLLDHVGLVFFFGTPLYMPLRALGRIAFPLFAYLFAEGCIFTRSRTRHFFTVFLLGALCQGVFFLFTQQLYPLNILLTLSLAMLLVFAAEDAKAALFSEGTQRKRLLPLTVFALTLLLAFVLNLFFVFDYGFLGTVIPMIVALFDLRGRKLPPAIRERDAILPRILVCGGLSALLSLFSPFGYIQLFCLSAVPILLLYNGKEGKRKMKYFFYLFYPLHLALIQGLYWLTVLF